MSEKMCVLVDWVPVDDSTDERVFAPMRATISQSMEAANPGQEVKYSEPYEFTVPEMLNTPARKVWKIDAEAV